MADTSRSTGKRRQSDSTTDAAPTSSPYFQTASSSSIQIQTPSPKQKRSRKATSPSESSKTPVTSPYFPSSSSNSKRPTRYAQSSAPLQLHGKPRSAYFYGLIQELLYSDPYYVLLAASLLNVSAGSLAIPILWRVLLRYPTCHSIARADLSELIELVKTIGLQNKRARYIKELGRRLYWIKEKNGGLDWGEIDESVLKTLPGIGPYAIDSYQIFCAKPTAQDSFPVRKPVSPLWRSLQTAIRNYEASMEAILPLEVDPPEAWNSSEAPIPTISNNNTTSTSNDQTLPQTQTQKEAFKRLELDRADESEVSQLLTEGKLTELWERQKQFYTPYVMTEDFTLSYHPPEDEVEVDEILKLDSFEGSQVEKMEEAPWQKVLPKDKELRSFLAWRWKKIGVHWDAEKGGVVGQLEGKLGSDEDEDSESED